MKKRWNLLEKQENRPFYIPTHDEVDELFEKGMIENASYKKLKQVIPNVKVIWDSVCHSDEPNEIIEKAMAQCIAEREGGVPVFDMKALNEMAALVIDCFNHTNIIINRGWEPMKLQEVFGAGMPKTVAPQSSSFADMLKEAEPELNEVGFKVDYESGFGEFSKMENGHIKKIKVGRIDPCPCGSGKKYKKCHGRAEKKKEKVWNSFVLFAPETMDGEATGKYYFYATEEFIILSKEKINSDKTEMVKCYVKLSSDGPHRIVVYDDLIYKISKNFPGAIEEVDRLPMCLGLADDDGQIIIHIVK